MRRWRNRVLAGMIVAPVCLSGLPGRAAAQGSGAWVGRADGPIDGVVDVAKLDPSVPRPGDVLGFEVGSDAVAYAELLRYLTALADASPLVELQTHGRTHEGRDLVHLVITSESNHERLEEIRSNNARLADPRLISEAEADRLVGEHPAVAWMAYSIHGDELSPCDSSVALAYILTASTDPSITVLRDDLVIIIDPLQNPDGRERYLAQVRSLRGKVPNPDFQAMHHRGLWAAGRGNHYFFDMNRDWIVQTQPETRGRVAAILSWNPHLIVDSHEMGGTDTFLFDPPREPISAALSAANLAWRRKASADQAGAFDEYGWSYYTQEWYEEWYPGYTNAWGALLGGIGILYEQAGVNADAIKRDSGEVKTYKLAVRQNVVSSLANLKTLRANREAVLRDYVADRRWAMTATEELADWFVILPIADGERFGRFLACLDRQQIEYTIAAEPGIASRATSIWGESTDEAGFPAGSIVISPLQPHRRLAHSILTFDPRFTTDFLVEERTELERGRGSRLYDATAWNLPMAFGLQGYQAESVLGVDEAGAGQSERAPEAARATARYGYLVPIVNSSAYRVLSDLLAEGVKVRAARKPFAAAGEEFGRGTLLVRNSENHGEVGEVVRRACAASGVRAVAVDTALSDDGPDLGGGEFALLHEPRVAIGSQWPVRSTSFGTVWWLLDDRLRMRVSPISMQELAGTDLRTYNVLVLPSAPGLGRVLNTEATLRLRAWVEAGGTLIATGESVAALAGADEGLSRVRMRSDVLEELEVYAEAVEREIAARNIQVDPDDVWGSGGKPPEAADDEHDAEPGTSDDEAVRADESPDGDALKRAEAWARRFAPEGAIAAADLDAEHWLCFGLGDRLPVPVWGGDVLMSKSPVHTPVRLSDAASLRLSGLIWPEARERLAHGASVTVERVGNGQVILFATDPLFRGYWEGTGRLLLNAILLGPGMGTEQPMPW